MSHEAMNWAIDRTRRSTIPPTLRHVLMTLANRADPEGLCWPSVRYVMDITGLAESTVRQAHKALVDMGLMRVEYQQRPDGGKGSNRYILCMPPPPPPVIGPTPPPTARPTHLRQPEEVGPPAGGHKTVDLDLELQTHTLFADANGAWDKFWNAYPRKTAKQTALKAWKRVKADEIPTLMAALEAHQQTDQWRRGVIPHPATWLNQRRWEDETQTQTGPDIGQCMWNIHGDRDPTLFRCEAPGVIERDKLIYCESHKHLLGERVR